MQRNCDKRLKHALFCKKGKRPYMLRIIREQFLIKRNLVFTSHTVLISVYRQSERIEHLSQKNIKRLRSFERTRLFIHENFSCFIERFHPKSRSKLIARPLAALAPNICLKLRIPSTFTHLFYRYMSDYVYIILNCVFKLRNILIPIIRIYCYRYTISITFIDLF